MEDKILKVSDVYFWIPNFITQKLIGGNWMCQRCGKPKSSFKIHNDITRCMCPEEKGFNMTPDESVLTVANAGWKINDIIFFKNDAFKVTNIIDDWSVRIRKLGAFQTLIWKFWYKVRRWIKSKF